MVGESFIIYYLFIYHLSALPYVSINDFIDPDDYSLSYWTNDDAYDFIHQMGPGTLLSKIDLKMPVDLFQFIHLNGISQESAGRLDFV